MIEKYCVIKHGEGLQLITSFLGHYGTEMIAPIPMDKETAAKIANQYNGIVRLYSQYD